eukprot:CAMPEP_0172684688 /NCGR_PEP_ID=MMETSP1074-20121228/19740_1 /TAXON_ID=2916 /ORGANISM="Ceratium fusus, Strain PA161109" /LENGTH=58 /DNA_ID=CAMNT_0013503745 /DNA_START=171 /DNA_END=345 /DNA_ORIENTATION=+
MGAAAASAAAASSALSNFGSLSFAQLPGSLAARPSVKELLRFTLWALGAVANGAIDAA